MATKVLTTLQDDIDGSAAVETVRFALDGVEWEIDLSERNANRLRNSLSDFIAHGRKVGGKRIRKTYSSNEIDPKLIRQWAEKNGIEVNSRGRIPAEIVERYKAAGN
jgi:Lsr2